MSRCKLSAFAKHVSLPTEFNHRPVSFVTVHGDLHSATARCNLGIKGIVAKRSKEFFKRIYVFKCRSFANVTAVKQDVNANLCHAFFLSTADHRFQMVDVRMHVTVREKAEEVESSAVCFYVFNKGLPGSGSEHLTAFDRVGYQLCTLCKYLTRTECVVTYFGVTHIVIRRKTNCSSVCLELNPRIFCHQLVQHGCSGFCHSIGIGIGSKTYTVHYNGNNRSFYAFKQGGFFKHCHKSLRIITVFIFQLCIIHEICE